MLLKLGEAGVVELLVSSQVLEEIESVVRRKAAGRLPALALLLDRSRARSVPSAKPDLIQRCSELVDHPGDAKILADAWENRVDFLVTLDKEHFLNATWLTDKVPFLIGTPGDCLAWIREKLQGEGKE